VSATAFTKSAKIECQNVQASGCKTLGQIIPDLALTIALVEQKDSWAGLPRGEIGGPKIDSIGGGDIDYTRSKWLLCRRGCTEPQHRQESPNTLSKANPKLPH
jgi:hypothetical protein